MLRCLGCRGASASRITAVVPKHAPRDSNEEQRVKPIHEHVDPVDGYLESRRARRGHQRTDEPGAGVECGMQEHNEQETAPRPVVDPGIQGRGRERGQPEPPRESRGPSHGRRRLADATPSPARRGSPYRPRLLLVLQAGERQAPPAELFLQGRRGEDGQQDDRQVAGEDRRPLLTEGEDRMDFWLHHSVHQRTHDDSEERQDPQGQSDPDEGGVALESQASGKPTRRRQKPSAPVKLMLLLLGRPPWDADLLLGLRPPSPTRNRESALSTGGTPTR